MRLEWVERKPFDLEVLWSLILTAGAVPFAFWLARWLPLPPCNMQQWLGLPCPTCGTSRTIRHLFAGEIWPAVQMSPGAVLGLILAGGFTLYAVTVVAFKLPRLRVAMKPRTRFWLLIGACTLLAANWVYVAIQQFSS